MEEIIARKYRTLKPEWNERQRRLWAASEAMCLGRGGVSLVTRATGLSRPTIRYERGFDISYRNVCRLLHELEYQLSGNRKSFEGGNNPYRNAKFEFINEQVKSFLKRGCPAISVDAKKKELILSPRLIPITQRATSQSTNSPLLNPLQHILPPPPTLECLGGI